MRLAAIGVYTLLGAPMLALEHAQALDLKHILHDTLSGGQVLASILAVRLD